MRLADVLRTTWNAQEHVLPDTDKFDVRVCQCCGFRRTHEQDPECVCDGLDWYVLPGGSVECQAHKFARAIGQGKKTFTFFRGDRG
jgi:hypothetical protein